MTPTLENYTLGRWTSGGNSPQELLDASTGEVIGERPLSWTKIILFVFMVLILLCLVVLMV